MPTSLNNIESKSKAFFQAARKQQTEIIEHRSVSLRQLSIDVDIVGRFDLIGS